MQGEVIFDGVGGAIIGGMLLGEAVALYFVVPWAQIF